MNTHGKLTDWPLAHSLYQPTGVCVQALYEVIDVIALGRIDPYDTTAFIMVIIVVCDWIGGQRGITLSDSIQAVSLMSLL
jgi:hypothetical protein